MTSHPEFSANTTATEVAAAFSNEIRGTTVLVVGVSPDSLGESLAVAIAQHSPSHLILASRSLARIQAVTTKLCLASTRFSTIVVDLASQSSIHRAAAEILSLTQQIDVLINNAGISIPRHEFTAEGIEMHFGVNHIGLFLLANLLKPTLTLGKSRVINLSSHAHRLSPIRFSDPSFERSGKDIPANERPSPRLPKEIADPGKLYNHLVAYGQSKTANVLMSVGINEKWGGKCVSYSVHPGTIWTNLPRHLDDQGQQIIRDNAKDIKSIDQGAATAMVVAFDPRLADPTSGNRAYLADCQFSKAAGWATDKVGADRLWRLSEEFIGQQFEISRSSESKM